MNSARVVARLVLMVLLAHLFGGGALIAGKKKPVEPVYLDESFSPSDVTKISILPVADVRKDKSIELTNLDEIGRKVSEKMLRKRGYSSLHRNDYGNLADISGEDIEHMDPDWLKELGSGQGRWMLLLVLEDLVTEKLAGAYTARCSGHLLDGSAGKAVWRDETTASEGSVGLAALVAKKLARSTTLTVCFREVLRTLPSR